ncbi:MAG: radical SAM protein [Planctomycetes bacterium]|nr:radical SAM protein [Planctomycetota bacterium]
MSSAPLPQTSATVPPLPHARELDLEGLEEALRRGPARRPRELALSLAAALYRHGALTRDEVAAKTPLGRERLAAVESAVRLGPLLELERRVPSQADGGARLVFSVSRLGGKEAVEAVAIARRDDLTLCLSSQAGCALGCVFCATGLLGFRANLTAGEIVEQHAWAVRTAGHRVTDVVFMGMGEPLLNYDAVIAAAYRLTRAEGPQISCRKIVISTVGIAPRIRQYAREGHPFQLFFSITSAIPEKRARLMPIEARYPLPELREAIDEFVRSRRRNRYATLQYVTIPGENMGPEDVAALGEFTRGLKCIVNVIPYNAVIDRFRPPTWREVSDFTRSLRAIQVPVKVRYSSGKSVAAGCGQLAADLIAAGAPSGHMTAPPGIFSDLHG